MRYFKQKDFNKCMDFLKEMPESVETQQKLYKFMHEDCRMLPEWSPITAKNMSVYSKIYLTSNNPESANWCRTMSNGIQVVWKRKNKSFYIIDEIGTNRYSYTDYTDIFTKFTELKDVDTWLLDNWSKWRFQETQRQLVAIWEGKYSQFFVILM